LILQPPGLAVLDWLGLGRDIRQLGARIDRLYGRSCPSQRVVLDVRYAALGAGQSGLAVHRAALFNTLFEAVQRSGLTVATGKRVVGVNRDGRKPTLAFADGSQSQAFDLIIDALGSRSPLLPEAAAPVSRLRLDYGALWTSLPWPGTPFDRHALEQRYRRASLMIGVLPIGRTQPAGDDLAAFFWSLKTDDYQAWCKRGLQPWKQEILAAWPETEGLLAEIADAQQMVLASYGHHTLLLPFGDRIAFIGDAAHSTSPQLGQGANMALLDVAALAMALERESSLAGASALYARYRRWHVRAYQALSCLFTPFYQSDGALYPVLRDRLVAPATRIPGIPRLLAKIVAGQAVKPLLPAPLA
jgi:2-polyprenyl-6-methoxyphenol hydroxylase-like FAD-dependent oxidoreductase